MPDVGVESVRLRGGELQATLTGEPIPRRISGVDLTVRLSSDYRNMTLDVAGDSPYNLCFPPSETKPRE